MDWSRAIERNSEALAGVVAGLAVLFELAGGATRISKSLRRSILRVLRPAEAAVLRLIVIAARGIRVLPGAPRAAPMPAIAKGPRRRLAFRLFDPRKRFSFGPSRGPRLGPRIHVFASDPRVTAWWPVAQPAASPPSADDGLADGRRLVLRFEALERALADLPGQARRLARLMARREAAPGLLPRSPLRPGPAPGARKVKVLDVDFVLAECHGLARDALRFDTS